MDMDSLLNGVLVAPFGIGVLIGIAIMQKSLNICLVNIVL